MRNTVMPWGSGGRRASEFAFETAASAFDYGEDPGRVAKALQILAKKAGIYGMIGGQVVDVQSSGHAISKERLDFIYELKTSALLEAAMMTGAVLAELRKKKSGR